MGSMSTSGPHDFGPDPSKFASSLPQDQFNESNVKYLDSFQAQDATMAIFKFQQMMLHPNTTAKDAMQASNLQKVLNRLEKFCNNNSGNPGSTSCLKTIHDFNNQLEKPPSADNNKILIQKADDINYSIAGLIKQTH